MYRKRRPQVTIPQPEENLGALYRSVLTLKELVEVIAGQRGSPVDCHPSWQDLVDIGLIKPDQVPKDVGGPRANR